MMLSRSVTIAGLCALFVAACSGGAGSTSPVIVVPDEPPPTESTTIGASATTPTAPSAASSASTTTSTTLPPIPRQPLTGAVRQPGEAIVGRPALVVKIDNAPAARPNHSGLAVADIVFEEIVEGDITRFAAIFHSQGSDPVGPIRSGRSQDVDIVTSFGRPLFAWSGGNPGVTRLIAAAPLVDLNWQLGGAGYARGPGRGPHDLYNDTETLWSQTPADHPGAPPQQFQYVRPGTPFAGQPASAMRIALRGIDVEWTWDDATQRFLRSQEGAAHVDAVHGRIGAANVVVMVVEYLPSQIDARSPEAQTIGNGPVSVFSRGRYVQGRWVRTSPEQPIGLVDADGRPILLEPGSTWIELAEAIPTGDIPNPDVALEIDG